MRDTNQWLRLNGWGLVSICVLILLVALGSCESTGAGGSDSGGTSGSDRPGEALLLPEGNITGWTLGDRNVYVLLVDANAEPVQGYGPVTVQDNGDFPGMSIDPPPSNALLSWADFQSLYCYELSIASITNDSVRFQSFCNVEVDDGNEILRGIDDGTVAVSWIYADGATAITASFSDSGYNVTIDLQLNAGWNRVVFQSDDGASTIDLSTEAEPAGTGWFLN